MKQNGNADGKGIYFYKNNDRFEGDLILLYY